MIRLSNKNKIVVFHHNDNDGLLSAFLVKKFNKDIDIKFVECEHGRDIPIKTIDKNDIVYVVDFNFPDNIWKKVEDITKNIIWIDHHITAIKDAKGKPREKHDGVRKEGDCGALLTWKHFNDETPPPLVVKLVDVYDVWKKDDKLWDDALNFMFATKGIKTDPNGNNWNFLLTSDKMCENFISKGKEIKSVFESEWEEQIKENGFETTFDGYRCFVINSCDLSGSLIFGDKTKDYDIVVKYCYNGEKYDYGLYSTKDDIHVGDICKQYGGGGHKGAAGFTDDINYFEED